MISDYSKQIELIKPHEFKEHIHVIGAGALGSWIVFILLKMGFENIHVYDFDTIEEHNIPNQLFSEYHIGTSKVEALDAIYKGWFADQDNLRLTIHNEKLTPYSKPLSGVIFSAVDSMATRRELYENLFKYNTRTPLWVEGRLSIYGAYIYTIESANFSQYDKYELTLYDDENTETSACGVSQTALPSAINAASMMVMQMIQWHNDGKVDNNQIEYSIPWLVSINKNWSD